MEYENLAEAEPASPGSHYFNSSVLSVSILAVLEMQVPIDDSPATTLLQNVFLPISPRFSSVMVVGKNGEKHWKKVEVNLQDHVFVPVFPNELSTESYDSLYNNYLSRLLSEDLPKNQPLWQVHIFKYPTKDAAGCVIFRLHHALGDGYSLMGALLSCLQRADNPSLPLTFPSLLPESKDGCDYQKGFGGVQQFISNVFYSLVDFGWSALKCNSVKDEPSPIYYQSWEDEVKFRPYQLSTLTFSLSHLKEAKANLGVTINDVVAGMVFLGSRLYMQTVNPSSATAQTTAVVCLNTRDFRGGYRNIEEMRKPNSDSPWGNHFTFLHVMVPELSGSESANPVEFVMKAHELIMRKRSSFSTYLSAGFLNFLKKFRGPEVAAKYVRGAISNSSFVISNMIGPVEQMSLANHPIKGMYFAMAGVPQCLNISIVSYMGHVRVAVGTERGLIDPQKFELCIQNAFEMILKAVRK